MIRCVAVALLVFHAILLLGLSHTTSLNRTEIAHLSSAAYFWYTGKFDLFHVNPPLTRFVVGIPVTICQPEYDWKAYSPRPQDRSEWGVGTAFIQANAPEKVHLMYFLGRCSLIPLILLGAWFGCKLATEMFGQASGLVFLVLWTFSPLFLGWGATICPDMVAAALGITACYFFRRWFLLPSWKNVIVAGICIGFLPLAKTTWIIAFGLFPLLWLLSQNRPPLKQICVVMFLALYMLNMGYAFDGSFRLLKDYTFISESLRGATKNRFENSLLGYVPVPLPGEFVQGIDTQKVDFEKGLESYLLGKHQKRGWWYYYPIVFVLKEPLGTLLLGLFSVALFVFVRQYRASWNDELIIIVPFMALLALMMSQTGFSIHPRYLLPALPFFYLFVSRMGKAFVLKQRVFQLVTVSCLVWMTASSLWSYPYSMSYFNEILPVTERPKLLLGSNIDWGQNAYFLKHWLEKHPEASPIFVSADCPEGLDRIGIKAEGTVPTEPVPGWFAISVNELYGPTGQYEWLKNLEPVDIVGNAIWVYHVAEAGTEK